MLDTTIVNVALPSIRADLDFTETSLVWVVNAYLLTFGGFLLLGGRLGDLFGTSPRVPVWAGRVHAWRRSPAARDHAGMLIAARAVQGLGGAVVSAVALSLIMNAVHRAGRAREGHGRSRLRVLGRRQHRRAAGRRADRHAQLALDLPGQRAHRRRRVLCCAARCCRRGAAWTMRRRSTSPARSR